MHSFISPFIHSSNAGSVAGYPVHGQTGVRGTATADTQEVSGQANIPWEGWFENKKGPWEKREHSVMVGLVSREGLAQSNNLENVLFGDSKN